MPAAKGNKNAVGNKGGGRKSAYEEGLDAQFHIDLWQVDQEVLKLKEKIHSRKYSVRDMFALKCLIGNEKLIKTLADKVLPDKVDSEGLNEGLGALEKAISQILKK